MSNICLVRLPFYKIYGIEKVHFPLSIGYLASYLESAGHRVSFVDGEVLDYGLYEGALDRGILNAILFYSDPGFMDRRYDAVSSIMENRQHRVWDIVVDHIMAATPDIIGMSCYTVNMTAANILADKIKSRMGNIPIIAGGIHPTSLPGKTLEEVRSIDYVVAGEGEESFLELVNKIDRNGRLSAPVEGVLGRSDTALRPRRLIENLDTLPFPKRYFYDKNSYIFGAPLLTSRGCPFSCTFCASHVMWTRKVRQRSVANVIEELKLLKTRFGASRIRILDDTFVLNKRWIREFCEGLRNNNLKFSFNCSGRINTVDEELFDILYKNGFDSIAFGIESGSPRIIKAIRKDIDLAKVPDVVKLANKYGFDTTSFYMIGHPGETAEDARMSEELFKRSMSKRGELSTLVPYARTGAGDEAGKRGFKFGIDDYYKFHHARNRILVNITEMSDKELLSAHKRFENAVGRRNYQTLFKKLARLILYFFTRRLR